MTATNKIRIILFSAPWCGACIGLKRSRVLNQLQAVNPSTVELVEHNAEADADGEELDNPVADAYKVRGYPTIVFEDAETGAELGRTGMASLVMLTKVLQEARTAPKKHPAREKARVKDGGAVLPYGKLVEALKSKPAGEG